MKKRSNDLVPWSHDCKVAFGKLKEALTNHPVLHAPDLKQEFIVHTDTSKAGVGAVLYQGDDIGHLEKTLHLACGLFTFYMAKDYESPKL